jgi:flavodoxin
MMKTLVVYDSAYGNTEKIARAIGGAIPGETQVRRVAEVSSAELVSLDLLIVGSPTYWMVFNRARLKIFASRRSIHVFLAKSMALAYAC